MEAKSLQERGVCQMEGAYLPGNIRQRMQELMKEHKITQAQLATRIGSTSFL